eukprot:2001787-Rhodomonas_salina.1
MDASSGSFLRSCFVAPMLKTPRFRTSRCVSASTQDWMTESAREGERGTRGEKNGTGDCLMRPSDEDSLWQSFEGIARHQIEVLWRRLKNNIAFPGAQGTFEITYKYQDTLPGNEGRSRHSGRAAVPRPFSIQLYTVRGHFSDGIVDLVIFFHVLCYQNYLVRLHYADASVPRVSVFYMAATM